MSDQMLRDLEQKLHGDMKRSMAHFCAMATIAGIRSDLQIASICSMLSHCLAHLLVSSGLTPEEVLPIVKRAMMFHLKKQREEHR